MFFFRFDAVQNPVLSFNLRRMLNVSRNRGNIPRCLSQTDIACGSDVAAETELKIQLQRTGRVAAAITESGWPWH